MHWAGVQGHTFSFLCRCGMSTPEDALRNDSGVLVIVLKILKKYIRIYKRVRQRGKLHVRNLRRCDVVACALRWNPNFPSCKLQT